MLWGGKSPSVFAPGISSEMRFEKSASLRRINFCPPMGPRAGPANDRAAPSRAPGHPRLWAPVPHPYLRRLRGLPPHLGDPPCPPRLRPQPPFGGQASPCRGRRCRLAVARPRSRQAAVGRLAGSAQPRADHSNCPALGPGRPRRMTAALPTLARLFRDRYQPGQCALVQTA